MLYWSIHDQCNCNYKCECAVQLISLWITLCLFCFAVYFSHIFRLLERTPKNMWGCFSSLPTFARWLKTVSPLMEDEFGQLVLTGSKTDFKDLHLRRKVRRGDCPCAPKRICQTAGTEQMWISIQSNHLSLQNAQLAPINIVLFSTNWFTLPISYIMEGSTS